MATRKEQAFEVFQYTTQKYKVHNESERIIRKMDDSLGQKLLYYDVKPRTQKKYLHAEPITIWHILSQWLIVHFTELNL